MIERTMLGGASLWLVILAAGCAPTPTQKPTSVYNAPKLPDPPYKVTDPVAGAIYTRTIYHRPDGTYDITDAITWKPNTVCSQVKIEHVDNAEFEAIVRRESAKHNAAIVAESRENEDRWAKDRQERDDLKRRVHEKDVSRWYDYFRSQGYSDDEAEYKAREMTKDWWR